MKKTLIVFVTILLYYGTPDAQDLPPDILADQYLLAATAALQKEDRQAAINAFQKIEALGVTPPADFFYFYGKVLVENGVATIDARSIEKGQSLLKKYVVDLGREAEHYRSALEVLNTAEEFAASRLIKLSESMVRVEGGTFTMGCTQEQTDCKDAEKPPHWVRVRSFEISKYEVTRELWAVVMEEDLPVCPQCPVSDVSWDDVQVFLQKLNAEDGQYRLPSEAEWEYAARGGTKSQGYRYAGSNNPDAVAWHSDGNIYWVGQKQANELGLYDMSGNVLEWVQDCWNESYAGAPSDGRSWESGDCSRRVLRDGLIPRYLRSASRSWGSTADNRGNVGFRIVRSLP